MFYYIKGELVHTDPTTAVVDCSGIGYKMTISKNTLSHLTRLGEKVCLYTYFYVREDALDLIGFYSEAELEAFKLLITVSGVGPKAALAILSVLTPEKFALAVAMGDSKAIAKAQGVGGKTAARVVLELKEKVAKTFPAESASAETAEPITEEENRALEAQHPEWNLAQDDGSGNEVLPKPVKKSLGFLLASIALWFAGYNGVTTWFTTYIGEVMGTGIGGASTCLLVGTAGAIVSYIPIGIVASKVGRKKMITFGTILLTCCFIGGYILTSVFDRINVIMYLVFLLVGLAWAAINVNSLPMGVEMCRGSDVGKFTGYYYTASMTAQVITPILAGSLLSNVGYWILFPYAAIFVFLSFVTMRFVKHGDAKAEVKKGLDAFEELD